MSPHLFGTDGVRGKAGAYPLDSHTIVRLGAALVSALSSGSAGPRMLIGRDTRESGSWIERELARGVRAAGGHITSAGVIPTPAIAFLTKSLGFDAGIMVSASHNPFDDNGIKVFSGKGEKVTASLESEIEAHVADQSWNLPDGPPGSLDTENLTAAYADHLRQVLPSPGRLAGLPIAVDCANGATVPVAAAAFRALGFLVTELNCRPDGRNINRGCGSTDLGPLTRAVADNGLPFGVAFDGDGDRALFVDRLGRMVDGDAVILMCAKHLKANGGLRGNAVVATVMSNVGLEIALAQAGIGLFRSPVGDKHVMEEILKRDLALGGEQSGHVIFSDYLYTGDGLITALSVLKVMAETGRDLADLASELKACPQVLVNVPVSRKRNLQEIPQVATLVAEVEQHLSGRGRVLIRYSGTEPLLRVMIEGQDQAEIQSWAERIAATARVHVG